MVNPIFTFPMMETKERASLKTQFLYTAFLSFLMLLSMTVKKNILEERPNTTERNFVSDRHLLPLLPVHFTSPHQCFKIKQLTFNTHAYILLSKLNGIL